MDKRELADRVMFCENLSYIRSSLDNMSGRLGYCSDFDFLTEEEKIKIEMVMHDLGYVISQLTSISFDIGYQLNKELDE